MNRDDRKRLQVQKAKRFGWEGGEKMEMRSVLDALCSEAWRQAGEIAVGNTGLELGRGRGVGTAALG